MVKTAKWTISYQYWRLLLSFVLTISIIQQANSNYRNEVVGDKRYPSRTLQCYSSLTQPSLQLICPEARMSWCVKEVIPDLQQNLCGGTQYYGDQYVDGQCVYKKCSAECVEETYSFEFDGQSYARQRYCCNNKNFCNSASKGKAISLFGMMLVFLTALYFFYGS